MGYEPVMSDYNDVLFDPADHTHTSCIDEVMHADMVVLIIGSRYGGQAIPAIQDMLDFPKIAGQSRSTDLLNDKSKISITQSEILKAVAEDIPVYTFIQGDVYHDHFVYERNKSNVDIAKEIMYPSIDKNETAIYIFEFINYLRGLSKNNAIFSFEKFDDITSALTNQWSGLFQSLLAKRHDVSHHEGIAELSGQIEDLKAMLMSSMSASKSTDLQETAVGVIEYRRLINVFSSFANLDLLIMNIDWGELLKRCKIKGENQINISGRRQIVIEMEDGTFYTPRLMIVPFVDLKNDWEKFRVLSVEKKRAIANAIIKTSNNSLQKFKHVDLKIDEFISQETDIPKC